MDILRFNEVYHQFISNLEKKYKLGQLNLLDNYESNIKNNDKYYLDIYLTNIFPSIDEVSACNIDFFRYSGNKFDLIDNLSIKVIIDKLILNKKKKKYDLEAFKDLCTYLMTLYLVILKDDSLNYVKNYIKKFQTFEIYDQMLSVIDAKNEIVDNWKENNNDDINFIKQKKETEDSNPTSESKASSNSGGSGNSSAGSSGFPFGGGGSGGFPFGNLENTEIGKLAGELAQKIEGNGNMDLPDIKNPNDIFGMLFGGGDSKGGSALGNIMTTVCSELDNKIKKGEIDQSVLFKEAQGLMGNSNIFNMVNQNNVGTAATTATATATDTGNSKKNSKKIRRKKKKKPVRSDQDILDETAKDMGI
jgi:hypothetical protein